MRLTPGALRLKLNQKFRHGWRVAWFRDVVRPRILNSPPVAETSDRRFEIHVLTSRHDWLNLIWSLKSFYAASGRRYALCIHEDGSLDPFALSSLQQHFPMARIIRRAEADQRLAQELRDLPRSSQFRKTNLLSLKVFDFIAFLQAERMVLFDSDLLFFDEPTAYLSRLEDGDYRLNAFNADCESAYTVEAEAVRDRLGRELLARVNSGFGIVHRDSMKLDWIEEFLAYPRLAEGHFWRIEQTLYALCGSRHGAELLPQAYDVSLEAGLPPRIFRHYVGAIRYLMYGEGIAHLAQNGFLNRCQWAREAAVDPSNERLTALPG
ncbi:hypothetical protein IVB30_10425 [Bradyrhizobium sp. 200]|uniref:hypothetical protein n=1 Tax=Bradyrhizobium sp. 200 TaxID=2782665 RepID=UPI001FFFBC29|nr:hypothetical protein [Bradyrhizobium sp. 200]UPJ51721.1 hypothetical protein IVB30_10425 [Bradyrhizobium sp. 200]